MSIAWTNLSQIVKTGKYFALSVELVKIAYTALRQHVQLIIAVSYNIFPYIFYTFISLFYFFFLYLLLDSHQRARQNRNRTRNKHVNDNPANSDGRLKEEEVECINLFDCIIEI